MVVNPVKSFFFAAGAAAAIVAIAWMAGGLDPYLPGAPPVVAALPGSEPAKGERVAEGEGAAVTPPAQSPAQSPAGAPQVVPPSFDIVRVEPDGSILIAGKAAPRSKVEILNGSQVIGSADAGPDGDFVAVLDDPLEPGDHQIVLRSTTPDNVAAASPETAIVSIPEQADGQVLALVEQPGEPSKLITVPEPAAPAEAAVAETAASAPAAEGRAEAQAPTPTQPAAPAGEQESADGSAAPAPAPAAAPTAPEAAPTDMAAVAPAAAVEAPPAAAPEPAAAPRIAVEAVEIEAPRIFVAGFAEPGSTVRVYANDILLGETEASAAGRFLIETVRDLPVGDYIIRADLLGARGAEVVARAAVPFEREEGAMIAAVAPPATAAAPAPAPEVASAPEVSTAPQVAAPAPEAEQPAASAPVPAAGDDAAETDNVAPSATAQTTPAPTAPAPEEDAAAAPAQAVTPVAEAPAPSAPAAQSTPAPAAPAPAPSQSAQAPATAPEPSTPDIADAAPVATPAPAAPVAADAPAAPAQPPVVAEAPSAPASQPAQPEPAADAAEGQGAEPAGQQVAAAPQVADPAPPQPVAVTAPKLVNVPGAVIIRRGDNLWRISTRVYGRGIRYSTIYRANEDQIEDPDMIFPGQVFSVPDKTPEGESADMEAVRQRLTDGGETRPATQ